MSYSDQFRKKVQAEFKAIQDTAQEALRIETQKEVAPILTNQKLDRIIELLETIVNCMPDPS